MWQRFWMRLVDQLPCTQQRERLDFFDHGYGKAGGTANSGATSNQRSLPLIIGVPNELHPLHQQGWIERQAIFSRQVEVGNAWINCLLGKLKQRLNVVGQEQGVV